MGDRAQVRFIDRFGNKVWFYTHWRGSDLEETVRRAIKRADDGGRLDDDEYFARIVFNEMTRGEELETTGFGIGFEKHGDVSRVITINLRTGFVTDFSGKDHGFTNFIGGE